ncbi:MAG TPA: Crp/Fnr family transcriptional regulator [Saprospiraceae bacterium]|nr:Crp/Fnr family transcriptional regulator [Saprospiraceae bacterium]
MNYYNIRYSDETCGGKSDIVWREFGIQQLANLYKYFGFVISDELIPLIVNNVEYKVIPKNENIIKEGEMCDLLFFLISGTVKQHVLIQGNRQVVHLLDEGNLFSSVNSFFINEPSEISATTCEKCRFLIIRKDNYQKIINSVYKSDMERFTRQVLVFMLQNQNKNKALLYLNSKEKIIFLMNEFPGIFDKFKMKDIASFASIKIETLSRARKEYKNLAK